MKRLLLLLLLCLTVGTAASIVERPTPTPTATPAATDWSKTNISDAIASKSDPATKASIIAQGMAAKIGTAKSISISKDAAEKSGLTGAYEITISDIKYTPKMGTLTATITATRDGKTVAVRNPVHFYGIDYRINDTSKIASGKIKEDPATALQQQILAWLETRPLGKCENDDTLVVYPSIDGYTYDWSDAVWATQIRAAGDDVSTSDTTLYQQVHSVATADKFDMNFRVIFVLNGSAIPDTATIDSAIFSVTGTGDNMNDHGGTFNYTLTNGALGSLTSIVAGDYDGNGTTELTDTRIAYSAWGAARQNWTLNAAGRAVVNKTGLFPLYLRNGYDVLSQNVPYIASKYTYVSLRSVDYATVGNRPFIEITYTDVAAPVANFTSNQTFCLLPCTVTFTDSSSDTPTSWAWDLDGDGDADSTDQHPSAAYLRPGMYAISLKATNAGGSDYENKTGYLYVRSRV